MNDPIRQFEYTPRERCICGSSLAHSTREVSREFAWGEVRFLRCAACGSWCQSPEVTIRALSVWMTNPEYTGSAGRTGVGYRDYLADEDNRVLEARGRVARDIVPLVPPGGRVLEIGCATGSLLRELVARGYDASGIDLSELFVERCRRLYGLEVACGDVLEVETRQDWFDAILLLGTISNLRDLGAYLSHFRRLLKPTGRLIFNFPDASSFFVRFVYGTRFWMFSPSVSCFMTGVGCAKALAAHGLHLDACRTDTQQPSLSKLFHHAGLQRLDSLLRSVGFGAAISPWPFPVPAVRFVVTSPQAAGEAC